MITAIVLATLRTVGIDILAAFGAICFVGGVLALIFAFLMRHRREHHKNTRGDL
jgi:predicted exporter